MRKNSNHLLTSTTVFAALVVGAPALGDGLNSAPVPTPVAAPPQFDFK